MLYRICFVFVSLLGLVGEFLATATSAGSQSGPRFPKVSILGDFWRPVGELFSINVGIFLSVGGFGTLKVRARASTRN